MELGNNVIYFRGTGEHKSKNEGNMGTYVILGSKEHRKFRFLIFGNKGKCLNISGEQGKRYSPDPGRASLIEII